MSDDEKYMLRALEEARKCRAEDDRIHPSVGVVIVRDSELISFAHRSEIAGGDHAEYTALEKKLATNSVSGSTVYTTLEPCTTRNHPKVACAFRLIERKVARVVIGMLDPNPDICGKGLWALRDSNVATDLFPHRLMCEVEELNRDFIRQHRRHSADNRTPLTTPILLTEPPATSEQLSNDTKGPNDKTDLHRFYVAMTEKRFDEAKVHYEAHLRSLDDDVSRKKIKIFYADLRFRHAADMSAIEELRKLVIDSDVREMATSVLGGIMIFGHDYTEAVRLYEEAYARADTPGEASRLMVRVGKVYVQLGDRRKASEAFTRAVAAKPVGEDLAKAVLSLADLHKTEPLKRAVLLAKASQAMPVDATIRFDAAYALSEVELTTAAAIHYHAALQIEPEHASALNNLGVACNRLGMPGKAVEYYRRAFANNNTLAAANMASKYVAAGFLEEAEKLLSDAQTREYVHSNVGAAFEGVIQAKKEEHEIWQRATETGKKTQIFISACADALIVSKVIKEMNVIFGDGVMVSLKSNGGLLQGENSSEPKRRRLQFRNDGLAGSIQIEEWQAYFKSYGTARNGIGYLSDGNSKFLVMFPDNVGTSFEEWTVRDLVLEEPDKTQRLLSEGR